MEDLIKAYESRLATETLLRKRAEEALAITRRTLLCEEGYPCYTLGYIASPFTRRRGAPRQGSLAPDVRASVQLLYEGCASQLEGLEGYSHVWVIYQFHDDEARSPTPSSDTPWAKAGRCVSNKISPPGMHGGRTGVLSTRSPHRPNALGLTLCTLRSVDLPTRTLHLSGCDCLDGTPVLDIKPYIPATDAPLASSTPVRLPPWVEGPLQRPPPLHVVWGDGCREALLDAVAQGGGGTLYGPEEGEVCARAIEQVLALDTRSVHQGRGGGVGVMGGGGHVTELAGALSRARGEEAPTPPPYELVFSAFLLKFTYGLEGEVRISEVNEVANT